MYNPNEPQTTTSLSNSARIIRSNFQQIAKIYNVDHVHLDEDDPKRGRHNKTSFAEQSGDPVTGANEIAIYTKDNSGNPDLYMRPESAGTVSRLTDSRFINQGLRLEAAVTFDGGANIVEYHDGTPMSYNVTSVAFARPQFGNSRWDDFDITFTNPITTANYFWVIGAQTRRGPFNFPIGFSDISTNTVNFQPSNNAVYSDTVKTTSFRLAGYMVSPSFFTSPSNPSRLQLGRTARINLSIYTVG